MILAEGSGAAVGLGVAAGATLQFNGALSTDPLGSFAVKSGPGTVRLSANENFSSPLLRMDLIDGTLLATSSTPSLTPRLLGGTVGGTGTVGHVTIVSGHRFPGSQPGHPCYQKSLLELHNCLLPLKSAEQRLEAGMINWPSPDPSTSVAPFFKSS